MEETQFKNADVDEVAINKISQKLASNDPHIRNYILKKLRRFLERSSQSNKGLICELNLLRLWKGLHFCMWMADKPVFQEELAEKLAALIHVFKEPEESLQFIASFLKLEAQEWHLLDFFRLDKFMMLVRKVMIQSLHLLQNNDWSSPISEKFVAIVDKVLDKKVASGFVVHVLSVLKDELRNLADGKLSEDDPRIELFLELFRKRNRKLVDNEVTKKKTKVMTVAECKQFANEVVTEKDIDDAAERMLHFEEEFVLSRDKKLKDRERQRKRKRDEDLDIEFEDGVSSDIELEDGDSSDIEQEDDVSSGEEEMIIDDSVDVSDSESSCSEEEVLPKNVKVKPAKVLKDKQHLRKKAKVVKDLKEKKPQKKKKLCKKDKKSEGSGKKTKLSKNKTKPKNKPVKRPKASDFF